MNFNKNFYYVNIDEKEIEQSIDNSNTIPQLNNINISLTNEENNLRNTQDLIISQKTKLINEIDKEIKKATKDKKILETLLSKILNNNFSNLESYLNNISQTHENNKIFEIINNQINLLKELDTIKINITNN